MVALLNESASSPALSGTTGETAPEWAARYARRITVTDSLAVIGAVVAAELIWFALTIAPETGWMTWNPVATRHTAASFCLIAGWLIVLASFGTRDARVVGQGALEYRRVLQSSLMLFGLFAIVAVALDLDLGRSFVLTAFPLAAVLLFWTRWMWRRWLVAERIEGRFNSRTLLVGSPDSVEHLVDVLSDQPAAGYLPVAANVHGSSRVTIGKRQIPVTGGVATEDVLEALQCNRIDCVVLTSSDQLTPAATRRLGWALEETGTELVVAPSLTDIAGPRMHTRPVAGLPLIHVESPVYSGRKTWIKSAIDRSAALLAVAILSPVLLAIAVLIRLSSDGPVIFRQTRVGLAGKPFTMYKFRSMHLDAEARLQALREAERDAGNTVMFKMKNDPRVTSIGRVLRRYSLDELPQLFNVIEGSMSLVGPRPPLDAEVATYEKHNHRRFLVRPGITGLWQVSGRSDLSWEDSVRLDLYYVENWSVVNDLMILARTARAVFHGAGAY